MTYTAHPQAVDTERIVVMTQEAILNACLSRNLIVRYNALEWLGHENLIPPRLEGSIIESYRIAAQRALGKQNRAQKRKAERERGKKKGRAFCPHCADSRNQKRNGRNRHGNQQYFCKACRKTYVAKVG
jgi:hypothetical protein